MATATTDKLSRAVSEIDLNAALTTVQTLQETGLRYTRETLISLRPKPEQHVEHGEDVETKQDEDGVKTPPEHLCPNPPPPTPATPETALKPVEDLEPVTEAASDPLDLPASELLKKKKKKKKSSKNKKPPVSGFEEFYADPPVTPDEYEEEAEIYDRTRPIHERIEAALQRYRARRKLDEFRSNVLTKYFMLGGVEASKKAFTGGELDKETLENCTAKEIEALKAQDYVRPEWGVKNSKYYDGSDDWVVDFEGVAKGFFSYRIPHTFSCDSEKEIKAYAAIIRNFLNYILAHQVCREYTEDVMAAKRICDQAEQELVAFNQLRRSLPGDFNIAASSLYGGRYKGLSEPSSWEVNEAGTYSTVIYGFSEGEAERIFKTAIALAGNDDMFNKTMAGDVFIVNTETKSYEVAKIEFPEETVIQQYAIVKNTNGEAGLMKPLGVVTFKPWEGPSLEIEDFTDDEGKGKTEHGAAMQSFWLEHDLLKSLTLGMKMTLMVYTLNIGISYFDIRGLYCSFYTKLPNELMIGWKEPVPNPRPAPTEDDPDAEERAMIADFDDEAKDFDVEK